MAEARDGNALDMAVKIANKGSRRMKITFHSSDPLDFCYDVANEIARVFEVDLSLIIRKVSKSFHYIFHMIQLKDKNEKRLKGIYEIRAGTSIQEIEIIEICKYDYIEDSWRWRYSLGEDKKVIGEEEDRCALLSFDQELQLLAKKFPLNDDRGFYMPRYGVRSTGGIVS